jgi:molecular chaperone GrpE
MSAKTYHAEPDNEETPQDAAATEAAETEAAEAEGEAPETVAPESDLAAENQELRERLARAMAETENVRRRTDRERKDAVKYATAPLAKDLLGVVDNLRRAIDSVPVDQIEGDENLKNLMSGVELTEKEVMGAFEKHGIQQIGVQPGDRFDPHYHEAMFEVPTDQQPTGTVVHVLQSGYMLHDRLLRPARVGVAKSAGGQNAAGNGVDTSA